MYFQLVKPAWWLNQNEHAGHHQLEHELILYINDVIHTSQCRLEVFADDSKIFSVIKSLNNTTMLQQDLDNIQRWSCKWPATQAKFYQM